mmetsp:Transcript_35643/g.84468  ORF Transcript_35643/g.84468 Transcript_35643/m.84468 type:complete len:405 (-) Transcript_35643:1640-2854(-)
MAKAAVPQQCSQRGAKGKREEVYNTSAGPTAELQVLVAQQRVLGVGGKILRGVGELLGGHAGVGKVEVETLSRLRVGLRVKQVLSVVQPLRRLGKVIREVVRRLRPEVREAEGTAPAGPSELPERSAEAVREPRLNLLREGLRGKLRVLLLRRLLRGQDRPAGVVPATNPGGSRGHPARRRHRDRVRKAPDVWVVGRGVPAGWHGLPGIHSPAPLPVGHRGRRAHATAVTGGLRAAALALGRGLGRRRVRKGRKGHEADPEPKHVVVERLLRLRKRHHRVLEAAEGALDKAVVLLVVRQERVPDRLPREHLRVPEDDDAVLGSGQGDVQAPWVVQETDPLVLVRPDAREDDVVLLTALERVDARHLNVLVELLPQAAVAQHHVDDVHPLTLVRGDDAYLRRAHP